MYVRVLAILVGYFACVSVHAEDDRLQGFFVNRTPSDAPIKAAIDFAVAPFNFLTRPIARSRLKAANPVMTRIEFAHLDKGFLIKLGDNRPTISEPGGPSVPWTRNDGELYDVKLAWKEATLVQSFTSSEGTRENRFSLSSDGNWLTIDVDLQSPMLKRPVRYRVVMERIAP